MKYRNRTIIVDAWQWLFTSQQTTPPSWLTDALWKWPNVGGVSFEPDKERICIRTPNTDLIASPGDWIVRDEGGAICPYQPAKFDALYEAIAEAKGT